MTNILALPLAQLECTTGNNEDWLFSLQYLQADEISPVDLTGIAFYLEMRAEPDDHDVVIKASTENGRLIVGGAGTSFLLIQVPITAMQGLRPGGYLADIQAKADGHVRVTVQLIVTVFEGITQ